MFTAWCQQRGLHLFQARRADIEGFGRDMDSRGRSLLVAAGLGAPNEHALSSLLAINGLRISEALGADIGALRQECVAPRYLDRTLRLLLDLLPTS